MVLMAVSLLSACVTINIYFPAAAAEMAADRIIDEVWQLQPPAAQPQPNPNPDKKVTP
ncbi:hypothetical protein [Azovibrio restrictus]|uniref:hypothetical protein n=1 Tax=Azovibrio restrictus TaxID=146938 RepID=UPI001FDF6182|nr:hypothetical protein [Azovibrio restrictus]